MPNGIAALPTSRYVLEGRVVTMGPQDIVDPGAVYVDAGVIRHVLPAGDASPPGFEAAPRIDTHAAIYPGLIELHNHLSYNAMPLWDVPQRFDNNGQWKNHDHYARGITKPSQVLGGTTGVVEALVRFVECRSLLGGVTTSQGITLSSEPGIKTLYKGLVRNVEQGGDAAFPAAGTRIANVGKTGAADLLDDLGGETCYLLHLSEGVDLTARGWFNNLRLPDGSWAITKALCGIHSTALQADDFAILKTNQGSMVWSPLSNYLLYGETARIEAAKAHDVLMALGCDWAPSGSKNLLGELKVAYLVSRERGTVLTGRELVSMATINAARILKWDQVLGSIEPGKRADLLVLRGQTGDDYMRVIEATEPSVLLVTIDGVPRVGLKSLLRQFWQDEPPLEKLRVGNASRYLYLADPAAHPLLRDLSLGQAIARLQDAMHNLPSLAQQLDQQHAHGLFSGSVDDTGTPWRIVLDFEEDPVDLALAARPLADYVQESMELDGITVAGDPTFLPKLMAARNLPDFVKDGLPGLYGLATPPPPFVGGGVETGKAVPAAVRQAVPLSEFLRRCLAPDLETRRILVDQALLLLEQNYVHLSLKRAMHAVEPIQRLRLLRHRMDREQEEGPDTALTFHAELTRIFKSLRDLHTTYRLPYPFAGQAAWLPFLVEEFWEDAEHKYTASKVVSTLCPRSFREGVEILYWNGMPIDRAVEQNAERQAGSNPAAYHAQGLNSLTIRPLSQGLPPDEEWVTLRYRDLEGKIREWTVKWLVLEPRLAYFGLRATDAGPEQLGLSAALGVDPYTDDIQSAKRILYGGRAVMREERLADLGERAAIANIRGGLETLLPSIFRAKSYGDVGYIRIFTFNVNDADLFIDEFLKLVRQLPQEGLIIDVRGNGGGLIYAAERLLQVLTPRPIEPERFEFTSTPLNLRLCQYHDGRSGPTRFKGLDLSPWIPSLEQSVETGAAYSLGFPITRPDECNDRGQQYYGPVALITDALCYSATDIFVAGFQDHDIGPILGISPSTGAGGANVWSHAILQALLPEDAASPYEPLPNGADLRVAIRRTVRVGPRAGVLVEDLGVQPDAVHRMTRQDVFGNNEDLIAAAAGLLAARRAHPLHVETVTQGSGLPRLKVKTRNVSRLDVWLNGRPRGTRDVVADETEIDLQAMAGGPAELGRKVELRAYDGDELAAVYRRDLTGT